MHFKDWIQSEENRKVSHMPQNILSVNSVINFRVQWQRWFYSDDMRSSGGLSSISYLIGRMKWWTIEQRGGWGVHKSVDVVVQVRQHVIHSEGRCYNAVNHNILFFRYYGVQSLAMDGLYGGDHVFAWHCHDTVTHTDWWGIFKRQGSGWVTRPG